MLLAYTCLIPLVSAADEAVPCPDSPMVAEYERRVADVNAGRAAMRRFTATRDPARARWRGVGRRNEPSLDVITWGAASDSVAVVVKLAVKGAKRTWELGMALIPTTRPAPVHCVPVQVCECGRPSFGLTDVTVYYRPEDAEAFLGTLDSRDVDVVLGRDRLALVELKPGRVFHDFVRD